MDLYQHSNFVIAGFCGIGKSTLCRTSEFEELECWKFRNGNFPDNYIQEIKNKLYPSKKLLISTDRVVINILKSININVIEVYPSKELKDEYMERYKSRKSHTDFIKTIDKYWDTWIDELIKNKNSFSIELKTGQYLSDVISATNLKGTTKQC